MVVKVVCQPQPLRAQCTTCDCTLEYMKVDVETVVYQQQFVSHTIRCPNCNSQVTIKRRYG